MNRVERLQARFEATTARWWFFLLIVFIQLLPPVTTVRYDYSKTGQVIHAILRHLYLTEALWLRVSYPAWKMLAIIMLVGLIVFRNRWARAFSVYAAMIYAVMAVVQSVSKTPELGVGIVTNNLVMFLMVSLAWVWEAIVLRTDYQSWRRRAGQYWVLPAAALAFWYPLNWRTLAPDFNPVYIFTSMSGIAFGLLTPVIVAVLIMSWPRVNLVTMRVTSLVGFIIGLYNIQANFAFAPERTWWNGVLHIPLLTISLYGLILSYRGVRKRTAE